MRRRLSDGEKVGKKCEEKPLSFEDLLFALLYNKITFAEFDARSRPIVRAMATRLYSRWGRHATGVNVEDLHQEILVAIWMFLPKWDPSKSSLKRFVVFNANDKAKKWLHVQRAAKRSGNADSAPSRREVLTIDASRCQGSSTEEGYGRFENFEGILSLVDPRDREIVAMLAVDLSIERVAGEIYSKPDLRREYRLCSRAHAIRVVKKVVRATATRVAASR